MKMKLHYEEQSVLCIFVFGVVIMLITGIFPLPTDVANPSRIIIFYVIGILSLLFCFFEPGMFTDYFYADKDKLFIQIKKIGIREYKWDEVDDILQYRGRAGRTFEINFKNGETFSFIASTKFRRYFLDLYAEKYHKVMECANL